MPGPTRGPFVIDSAWRRPRRRRTRHSCANRRGVGPPRNPLPRKKIPADLRSLARGHTELCIRVLAGIVSQEGVPRAARVSAAGILLDRGWGSGPASKNDGEQVTIVIRRIIDGTGLEEAASAWTGPVIEGELLPPGDRGRP